MDRAAQQDIEFLKGHDGSTFICLKSRERGAGGWPAKYGSCAKLKSNNFVVYEGNLHAGDAKELGVKTPEEIVEEWMID